MSKLSQFGKTEVIGLNTKAKSQVFDKGFQCCAWFAFLDFFLFWINGWCSCMIEYLSCFKTNICLNWRFLFPSFELVFQQSVECPPWQMLAIGPARVPSLICIQRLHLDSAPTAVVIYGNLWHNLSYWLFGLCRRRWLMMRSSLICIERLHLDSAGVPWNVIYGNRDGFEKSFINGNTLFSNLSFRLLGLLRQLCWW